MPRGTHHRLSGLLIESPRGLLLQTDSGGIWALDVERGARHLLGRRVTVEGVRNGFDRIDVAWIGEVAAKR